MRLITPSQLSQFSISPVIGAWWQELDQQLFADGLRHEEVLFIHRHEASDGSGL